MLTEVYTVKLGGNHVSDSSALGPGHQALRWVNLTLSVNQHCRHYQPVIQNDAICTASHVLIEVYFVYSRG